MKFTKKMYFLTAAAVALLAGAAIVYATDDSKSAAASVSPKSEMKKAELAAEASFDDAIAAAKKEGKILMLEFTGSSWCPPCQMLHKFILNTEDFAKYAKEKLRVVVADFERWGEPKNKEQAERYKQLAQQYQLQCFPTVVLIDPATGQTDVMVGLEVRSPKEMIDRIENFKKSLNKK